MSAEIPAEPTSEHKAYRRVMCCKIHQEHIEQFLEIFEEEEWYKVKKLGKRGAVYSYIKALPNKTRYHCRLYEIDDYFYFLIHHEPTLRGSVSFHILGLFDRFRSRKENVLNSEKLELANYQIGIDYFKQEIVAKHPILREICEYDFDEDELKYFAMKFGYISLKLPVEILIEDLFDAIITEDDAEFYSIVEKLFTTLEFHVFVPETRDYLVIESTAGAPFKALILKVNLDEFDLTQVGPLLKEHALTAVLLVPRKQDNISATLNQKLVHLNISIVQPINFLRIFNIYKNLPIAPEQFQQLFKGGLISSDYIDDTLQTVDFAELLNKAAELYEFLKRQTGWTSLETLEYELVEQKNFKKDALKQILDFLSYPLINLVLVKREPRRFRSDKLLYRAIKNFDEIQFRLKNIRSFLSKIT